MDLNAIVQQVFTSGHVANEYTTLGGVAVKTWRLGKLWVTESQNQQTGKMAYEIYLEGRRNCFWLIGVSHR